MKENEMSLAEMVLSFKFIQNEYLKTSSKLKQLELIARARHVLHEMEECGVSVDDTDTFVNTVKLYPLTLNEISSAIEQESLSQPGNGLNGDGMIKNITCDISKINEDQNLVFGWAYVSENTGEAVVDYQGDSISESELEKAFYDFVINARNAGEMHKALAGTLVECMVFTKEKQAALGIDLGMVGAWVGFKLNPDVFAKVKSGEYKMLSIGGRAKRVSS